MNKDLPFFNWSLKEVLNRVPDSLSKARIKIILTIVTLAIFKVLIVVSLALASDLNFQLIRAIVILITYVGLLKWLFYKPSSINLVAHLLIVAGNGIIWSSLLLQHHHINVVILQFVFMVSLCSFYLIDKKYGVIYSVIAIVPVFICLLSGGAGILKIATINEQVPSIGLLLLVFLNFITIIYSHFLFYQAIQQSIQEKAELNNKLSAAVTEANRLALSKSDFLSIMSHELRTPLNAVLGSTNILLNDHPTESQKEELRVLNFSTNNLLNLVNDILDFNKMESEKMELERIPVHLAEVMKNICAGLRFAASEKGLSLILNVDEPLSAQVVLTDPTRLTQVVYNLIWNAIKFTDKGSVTVTITELVRTEHEILIRFLVSDTGIGIDADRQEAIFEPFTQAYSNTTRHFGGTGLGLAIVKRFLHLFKSSIHLSSTPDKGSDFFFDISFEPAELSASPVIENLSYDLSGLKIIVAEDNQMNVLLMKKLLSKWNAKCSYAGNGQELMALIKETDLLYDVILMDLNMPVMDGIEATKAIRAMHNSTYSNIPIIALTASVSDEIKVKILDAGMNDFIYKPFEAQLLFLKLRQIHMQSANSI